GALKDLRDAGEFTREDVVLRFRAPVHEDFVRERARSAGVEDLIEVQPQIAYRDALAEMLSVDALLVLQNSSCNEQIPAKLYEYLRTGRPILGLTDPPGDTARLMQSCGLDAIAPLESRAAIAAVFPTFLRGLRDGQQRGAALEDVARYSRVSLAGRLAKLLDSLTA
ncbi:MAG: glycosyltransferase, partial [Pseudomonadota bacterium]